MDLVLWEFLQFFGGWVAGKGLDALYRRLTSRRRSLKEELISAVDSALAADHALAEHCDDVPKVAKEVIRHLEDSALLQSCLTDDTQALVRHIQQTEGFSLPGFTGTPENAASLLRGVAQVAIGKLMDAVKQDDALFKEFMSTPART